MVSQRNFVTTKDEKTAEDRFSNTKCSDESISELLFTDITEKMLYHEISQKLGIAYLSDAQNESQKEASGIIHGKNQRPFVSLVVQIGQKQKNVIFIVNLYQQECDRFYGL